MNSLLFYYFLAAVLQILSNNPNLISFAIVSWVLAWAEIKQLFSKSDDVKFWLLDAGLIFCGVLLIAVPSWLGAIAFVFGTVFISVATTCAILWLSFKGGGPMRPAY